MEMRRNAIAELVNKHGTVSFAQIKEQFPQVSEMTLRTDLKALDAAKEIVRIHGGAKSVQLVIGTDPDYLTPGVRYATYSPSRRLQKKQCSWFFRITVIFLGSGSTTTELARIFPDQSNLIYTTGLSCATELANLTKPVIMLPGGQLNRYSISMYGISAIRELEQMNFHQTFLGVTGYSMKAGFTCGNNEEAMLKRTAIEQAEQVVVLMDSSKTEVKSTYTICGLADVDVIISDGQLPEDFLVECETHHITVY